MHEIEGIDIVLPELDADKMLFYTRDSNQIPTSPILLIKIIYASNLLSQKFHLTLSETKMLIEIAIGKTANQIAKEYFLSKRTVEQHIANIKKKIDYKNRAELFEFILIHDKFLSNN